MKELDATGARFLAGEFATLAGVTVRTLHHYDRLGLLSPAVRNAAGYRLYGEADLARLQHVAALKFLGVPLRRIKELLSQSPAELRTTLRLQRSLLVEQRNRLDAALQAIERAERVSVDRGGPDWPSLRVILEVLKVHRNSEWMKKYYTEEQLADLAARAGVGTLAQGERDWAQLIADAEAAIGDDPAGERGQEIAARWQGLIDAFTGGDPGIRSGLQNLYADRANWPAGVSMPYSAAVGDFIAKALAARKCRGD